MSGDEMLICPVCRTENPSVARFCMQCGSTLAREARPLMLAASNAAPLTTLHGEQRLLTVLHVALPAPAAASDSFTASLPTLAADLIRRYQGTPLAASPRELLGVFGMPAPHEDDALRALRVAFELVQQQRDAGAVHASMRLALHSGSITLSHPDALHNVPDHALLEPVVQPTHQMVQRAEPEQIMLSDSTRQLLPAFLSVTPAGQLAAQPEHPPELIFSLNVPRSTPDYLRHQNYRRTPLIGREQELAALQQASAAVLSGVGRAILIIGDPGIGKSRLLAEWKATVRESEGDQVRWIEARCRSFGREIGYHLLVELVHAMLELSAPTDPACVAAALTALAADLPDRSNVLPYLAHLLGLRHALPTNANTAPPAHIEPRTLRNRYLHAIQVLVQTLAQHRPLILVLEDMHWADPSSVELLLRLIPLISELPMLLCLTSRPERESAGWRMVAALRDQLGDTVLELPLHPLNRHDTTQLVAALLHLDSASVPPTVRDLVLARADGNPYFMEELVRVLIDQQLIVHDQFGWTLTDDPTRITIPDTLQALLQARIDQLALPVRQTIRVAAVIGRQFAVPVLARVLGHPHDLLQHLTTLERAGLIQLANARPQLEYRFRHALVQEAAYAALLADDRADLHYRVGEALEQLYPDQRQRRASSLARHFTAAGVQAQAVTYAILAGQVALTAFANQEAEGHFRTALSRATTDAARAEACAGLGIAVARQSRYLEAITIWSEGIEYAYRLHDLDLMARLYARAARAASYDDDYQEALRLCQEGVSRTSHAAEGAGLAALLHEAGRAYHFNGIPDVAYAYCERALAMAERLHAVDVQAEALTTLAILPEQPPAQAQLWLEQAVALAEPAGLLQTAARAHYNLSVQIITHTHDFAGARYHAQRATELAAQQGIAAEELMFRRMLVQFDTLAGDFARAESNLATLHQLARQSDNRALYERYIEMHECDLLNMRGLWEESSGRLRVLLTLVDPHRERDWWIAAATYLVDALTEMGAYSDAEVVALNALELDMQHIGSSAMWLYFQLCSGYAAQRNLPRLTQTLHEMQQVRGSTYQNFLSAITSVLLQGRTFAAYADWDAALHELQHAEQVAQQMGVQWWSARILLDQAEVLLARAAPTDLEQARTALDRAQVHFERLGAGGYAARARERLTAVLARIYEQAISLQAATRELSMAGAIQSGLLPESPPDVAGWHFAASFIPAREIAGDFYDWIELDNGIIGLTIADVAEKGAGAALYMALGRTLIRTYARAYPDQPEMVLSMTNRHMLEDTPADLFITAFYGVLDPATGVLTYCNAGHNPPLLFSAEPSDTGVQVQFLPRTGILLGVTRDSQWHAAQVTLRAGDTLLCYTDGITEARDANDDLFGVDRLIALARTHLTTSATHLCKAILERVDGFVGDAPQEDDITLLITKRERVPSE